MRSTGESTQDSREQLKTAFGAYRNMVLIDLAIIRSNGEKIRKLFPKQKIMSVLKADAYGHGIHGVLPAYEAFSDWYAVATYEEAMAIRNTSKKPILLFGPIPENLMANAAQHELTFTVGDYQYAKKLSEMMVENGITANCHLKIDTGLNRAGVRWRESEKPLETIKSIFSLPSLAFTGTYTHFACGEGTTDSEQGFTSLQFLRYEEACSEMEAAGLPVGLRHCCATGGAVVHPEYRMDMVRLGMLPLGMSFSKESIIDCGVKPALQWVAFICQIKNINPGETISYSCTFEAEKPMCVGLVSCGYADGYHRIYSNKAQIVVGGKRVRVLGVVAMDYFVVDLTDVEKPVRGMPAFLIGSDGFESVSAIDLSEWGNSVCGEVTCSISQRVPRIYLNS